MSSEKQGQKREELRRRLNLAWTQYERLVRDAPRPHPANTSAVDAHTAAVKEARADIERQSLVIYLNADY